MEDEKQLQAPKLVSERQQKLNNLQAKMLDNIETTKHFVEILFLKSLTQGPMKNYHYLFLNDDFNEVFINRFWDFYNSRLIKFEQLDDDKKHEGGKTGDLCIVKAIQPRGKYAFQPSEIPKYPNFEGILLGQADNFGDYRLSHDIAEDLGRQGIGKLFRITQRPDDVATSYFIFKYGISKYLDSQDGDRKEYWDIAKPLRAICPGMVQEVDPDKINWDNDLKKFAGNLLDNGGFNADTARRGNLITSRVQAYVAGELKKKYVQLKEAMLKNGMTEINEFWTEVNESILSFEQQVHKTLGRAK